LDGASKIRKNVTKVSTNYSRTQAYIVSFE
jgi:hypothetical protein